MATSLFRWRGRFWFSFGNVASNFLRHDYTAALPCRRPALWPVVNSEPMSSQQYVADVSFDLIARVE